MEDKLQTLHEEEPQTQVTVYRSLPYAPTRKFLPGKAKQIIGEVLREKLGGIEYDAEAAPGLCRDIADAIRVRLKEFEFERYKIIVQAVVGEMRNQGFQMACKCFWDPDTDDYAEDSFTTDRLFGIAVVFGMYYY